MKKDWERETERAIENETERESDWEREWLREVERRRRKSESDWETDQKAEEEDQKKKKMIEEHTFARAMSSEQSSFSLFSSFYSTSRLGLGLLAAIFIFYKLIPNWSFRNYSFGPAVSKRVHSMSGCEKRKEKGDTFWDVSNTCPPHVRH